ncbi:hypothetical protein CR513_24754, partial [Mucuna pruriens]
MRQCKWLEFLKDYDFDLSHHLGKANVVVNVLSRKSLNFRDSSLVCEVTLKSTKLGMLKVTSDLMEESRESQKLGLRNTNQSEFLRNLNHHLIEPSMSQWVLKPHGPLDKRTHKDQRASAPFARRVPHSLGEAMKLSEKT